MTEFKIGDKVRGLDHKDLMKPFRRLYGVVTGIGTTHVYVQLNDNKLELPDCNNVQGKDTWLFNPDHLEKVG